MRRPGLLYSGPGRVASPEKGWWVADSLDAACPAGEAKLLTFGGSAMGTWIIRLVAVGGACYFGYSYVHHRKNIHELQGQLQAQSAAAVAPAGVQSAASTGTQVVQCESCNGLGRLVMVSRGLSPQTGSREVSYTCPVCSGLRQRMVVVGSNSALCTRCRGMGRTEVQGTRSDGSRVQAQSCALCRGSGVYAQTFP
jgi:DnaJ-class molecular chaperone